MLCLLDNLPNLNLALWVLGLEMWRAPPNSIAMVGQPFWFFKHSCSVAQNDPFFRRPILHAWQPFYNFRSPKGDFEKNWAWNTDCVCANEAINKDLLGLRWGGLNHWCCVHGSYNLEKALKFISRLEKTWIQLRSLKSTLLFYLVLKSPWISLLSYFWFFLSSAISVLQINCKSCPVTFVIFQSVAMGSIVQKINKNVNWSTVAEKGKITNDSAECFSQ